MRPFLAATYGDVSDIELIWVLIAFIGMIYSAINTKSSLNDLKWLDREGISNGRRVLGKYSLVNEILRGAIQTIFFVIGILAMFLPEPSPMIHLPFFQVAIGFAVRWGLIAASVLLTIKSYLGKRIRDILKD